VWLDQAGKLVFGEALAGIAKDSRLILSRELRHSVLKLMPATATPAPPSKA
jgi:glycerol-3-phosphate O-acyltransferase